MKRLFRDIFKRRMSKTISLLMGLLAAIIALGIMLEFAAVAFGFILTRPPALPKISYTKFVELALTDNALDQKVIIKEEVFITNRKVVAIFSIKENQQKAWTYFDYSPSPGVSPQEWLRQRGYNVFQDAPFPWGYTVYSSIQLFAISLSSILMMGVFIYFIAGGGITKAMQEISIVRASKKLVGKKVTLEDVAGIEPEKARIKELIKIMRSTDDLKAVGALPPRGIFLHGPPGTGKSLLARAIIHESGLPSFWTSGADFGAPLVGIAAQKADTLFEEAFRAAPSILVIDEMDSAAPSRARMGVFESGEKGSLVNKILSLQDRIEKEEIPVYVIGITNFMEAIDPAILREGRFDDKIEIPLPMTIEARKAILTVHTSRPKPKPLAPDVNLESIARQTFGFSGAFLATLVNKAALRAASQKRKIILQEDFEESIELVSMGPIRELKLTDREIEIVSRHEAGHAFADHVLPGIDSPQIVSLMPRGKTLGFCWAPQKREYFLQTKERMLSRIKSVLAGYAVEKLLYGEAGGVTTGPSNDLKAATYLAHDMVFEYGMNDLGPINFGQKVWSPETIREAEKEVINILQKCEKEMEELFSQPENKEKLLRLSSDLLKTKRLDYAGIVKSIGEPPKKTQ